jgi:membrane protease YdiL (CAAX protease family)
LLFICLKKKQYSFISVKVNKFIILLIPLYFISDFFNLSHTFLVIITLIYLIQYLDKKETQSFNFAIFKSNLSHLIVCWPLILLTSFFSMLLFSDFNEQKIVSKLKNNVSYSLLFSSIIIAPIIEEIFFRKFVYRVIKKKLGIFFGILISSLMFGLIHYNLYSFGTLFLLSVICTIKFENTGQIFQPILIHSFFNTIMVIFTLVK